MLTFSQLLQKTYDLLGHQITKGVIATGGSTTTVIDTTLSDDFQDDHFLNYYAFVHRDAGGAGAAPEGEFQKVTAYTASTKTLTTSAFSAAISAGDELLLVKPNPFPLADVKRLCNAAIQRIGEITLYDTSITTVADQTEYTLPSYIRQYPTRIWVQESGRNLVQGQIINWRVESATEGSNWTLVTPEMDAGLTLRIEYRGLHPTMSAYDDEVVGFPPSLAAAACAAYIAKWHSKTDEEWLNVAGLLEQEYQQELLRNRPHSLAKKAVGMPHWDEVYWRDDAYRNRLPRRP